MNRSHWSLAVLYVETGEVLYYDSLNLDGRVYVDAICRRYVDFAAYKNENIYTSYEIMRSQIKVVDVPQQIGGYDCGVFTLICADCIFFVI